MSQEQWTTVDNYIASTFAPSDAVLDAALQSATTAGLPAQQVTPNQGKLLAILAQSRGARTILEIGTLGGYSTIWMARVLPPNGSLITLEADPHHAMVARENIARAGLSEIITVRVGSALDTLPQLVTEGQGPFDLVFIDADKTNNVAYLGWALELTRRGSLIIADNVVRNGAIADANSADENVQGVRRFHDALAAEPRVTATSIQTVGSKGYDGFTIALVIA